MFIYNYSINYLLSWFILLARILCFCTSFSHRRLVPFPCCIQLKHMQILLSNFSLSPQSLSAINNGSRAHSQVILFQIFLLFPFSDAFISIYIFILQHHLLTSFSVIFKMMLLDCLVSSTLKHASRPDLKFFFSINYLTRQFACVHVDIYFTLDYFCQNSYWLHLSLFILLLLLW